MEVVFDACLSISSYESTIQLPSPASHNTRTILSGFSFLLFLSQLWSGRAFLHGCRGPFSYFGTAERVCTVSFGDIRSETNLHVIGILGLYEIAVWNTTSSNSNFHELVLVFCRVILLEITASIRSE